MQLLTVSALLHGVHHDIFRSHKRKLASEALLDDFLVDHETVRNIQAQIKDAVDCEEALGNRNTLVCGVIEGALKPLRRRSNRRVESVDDHVAGQRCDTLGAHRVSLVCHCRGTDLVLLKRLLHFLQMLKEADIVAHLVSRSGDARNNVHHTRVNLAGVSLAGYRIAAVKAHLCRDHRIERVKLLLIIVEEFLEGRLGSGRSLAAEKLQCGDHVLNVREIHTELLDPQRRALADSGRLRRLKMRKRKRGKALVFVRKLRKLVDHVHKLSAHKLQSVAHHDDIGVVAYVAARSSEVNDTCRLRALKSVGIDMAHNVMAHQLLALLRNGVVNVIDMCLHLVDHFLCDDGLSVLRKSEFHLCLREGDPKLSPCGKFLVLAEDILHLRGGVTLREGACVTVGVAHTVSP